MSHYSALSRIVIDAPAAAHDDTLAFWREALGLEFKQARRFPAFHTAPLAAEGLGLLVQRLDDGPGRIHLDIHTTDRSAEVSRLSALGASVIDEAEFWTVMRDPAGLVFCVVTDTGLNESNANTWP